MKSRYAPLILLEALRFDCMAEAVAYKGKGIDPSVGDNKTRIAKVRSKVRLILTLAIRVL